MLVSPFTQIEYKFDDQNVKNLIACQTKHDKILFDMDMANMQWKQYYEHCVRGCMQFLLHESGKPNMEVWKRYLSTN